MLINFLMLCMIPLVWTIAAKLIFRRDFHWIENIALFFAGAAVIGIGVLMSAHGQTSDTLVVTGQVIGKERKRVSCEHSYSCNCRTNSKGRRSCSICYHHSYDFDWYVNGSVGDTRISRVDGRGSNEPPRWSAAKVGEPYAKQVSYTNYVMAAPKSLFRDVTVPEGFNSAGYPGVHDYYRRQPVFAHGGANVPNLAEWNAHVTDMQRSIGPLKEVDTVIIFTKEESSDWARQLEASWRGSKKNSAVVVVGVGEGGAELKASWAYAFTFANSASNSLTAVKLRDVMLAPGAVNRPDETVKSIGSVLVRNFKRKHMDDFKYLSAEIRPTLAALIFTGLALLVGLALLTKVFISNNLSASGSSRYRY